MEENWVSVVGFEGFYEVNSVGCVKSVDRYVKYRHGLRLQNGKILKQNISNSGYYYVDLCKNNKSIRFYVHRIVAEAFITNPENLPCVNHKNQLKTDNRVENIEWCTKHYNNTYGDKIDKISLPVKQYSKNGSFIKQYKSIQEASRENNIHPTHISECCRWIRKTAGKYIWRYAS